MNKYTETTIIRGTQSAEARLRLIAAREANEWTQEQLGEKLGWGQSRLSMYENGKRSIGPEEAAELGRVFNVPDTWFLGVTNRKETELIALERNQRGEIHEPPVVDRGLSLTGHSRKARHDRKGRRQQD